MKKIKVLIHTQPNKTSFNAQDLNGREVASRFNEDEFEIYFINTFDDNIDEKLLKKNIHILDARSFNPLIRKWRVFKYKLLKKYDISFYIRVFKNDSYFLRLLPFFDKNRKTIHIVENLLPYPNSSKEYQETAKFNALNSTKIFSISEAVRESVKKEYGVDTEIVHVGVDTSIFVPPKEKRENNRLKIVSVGTFQKRKQPDLFADIAKEFPNQDFYWIGEGELKENIKKRVEKEDINNLKLLSNMPHDKLSKFLQQCDIFLFPSIHEGFGKVTIEAMSCGLPAIIFDNYKPENVIDNKTGFIVSNKKEMKEKLKLLIEDKKLREEFSKNAVKRAKEFDWGNIAKKWESVIKGLLNR